MPLLVLGLATLLLASAAGAWYALPHGGVWLGGSPSAAVPSGAGSSGSESEAASERSSEPAGGKASEAAAEPAQPPLSSEEFRRVIASYEANHPKDHRGIYISGATAGTPRMWNTLIHLVERTELNAVVIDVKEDGHVLYDSQDPLVRSVGAIKVEIPRLKEQLDELHQKHIYAIARIVTFKDSGLAKAHPEWAVQDARGGVWRDRTGAAWMNAYNENVWEYNIAIAKEAVRLGFDEIQFDYVRFPSDGAIRQARYPGANGRTRVEAITGFLERARTELGRMGVPVSADIFGLIPTALDDQMIGQHWEEAAAAVHFISPMAYPSHYAPRTFGLPNPNAAPAETVAHTMDDAIRRRPPGGALVRPWLQDFSLYGVHYTPEMVRAEIDAAERHGAVGWLLWNAANCYKPDALKPDPNAPPLPKFGDHSTCEAAVSRVLNGGE